MPKTMPMSTPACTLDFDSYRDSVSRAVVALDVNSPEPAAFRGSLGAEVAGDIHMLDIAGSAHAVNRTPGLITRAAEPYYKFTVIERGTALIVQDGRETVLGAGDMAIYDTERPYSLLFDSTMRVSVVMFPKDMLAIPAEAVQRLTAVRFSGSVGAGALLRPYLGTLSQQMADLDRRSARRLFCTAIDMVGTVIESQLGADAAPSSHEQLMRKILDFIDEQLCDSELGPNEVAAAHFISVRHLHGLFKEHGSTVSSVIRARRLDRCYDQLTDPAFAETSVAAIAFANGFAEPAHFSRSFRARFGVSPGSLRAAR